MILVRSVLGNLADRSDLAQLAAEWEREGGVERLRLTLWDAQKTHLRRRTDRGTELGLTLPRGTALRDGDVLWLDREQRRMVVAALEERRVLVIDIVPGASAEETARTALRLGHVLGNQHWPVRIEGLTAYVPVVIDEKVMATVLKTHNLPGIRYEFRPAAPDLDLPLVAPSWHPHAHGPDHPPPGPLPEGDGTA